MQLLIFRHGIAEENGPDGADASRRLTAEGVRKTRAAARGLARLADRPTVILTSPKTRAVQTADALGKAWNMKPQMCEVLAEGPAAAVVQALGRRKEKIIAIVGHEPTLGQVIEQLCTRGRGGNFIDLKKAGCACVEVQRRANRSLGSARLLWLATPRFLRGPGKKK